MERTRRLVISACRLSRVVFAAFVGAALGCGQAEPAASSTESDATSQPTVASASPAEAIHELMLAYKNGNDAKAAALLTEKSRQETERKGKAVSPPMSPTMQFKVGEVDYVSEAKDAAHVGCHLSEVGPDGEKLESDVVWFLRKEPTGWRVAGIAMKPFPDQLPVLYNFEDQDDMERKIDLVIDEMDRREREAVEQAKKILMQAQQPAEGDVRKQ